MNSRICLLLSTILLCKQRGEWESKENFFSSQVSNKKKENILPLQTSFLQLSLHVMNFKIFKIENSRQIQVRLHHLQIEPLRTEVLGLGFFLKKKILEDDCYYYPIITIKIRKINCLGHKTYLRLCLVLKKFKRKYKGKCIKRKNRIKEKMKKIKNRIKVNKLFFYTISNSFYLYIYIFII